MLSIPASSVYASAWIDSHGAPGSRWFLVFIPTLGCGFFLRFSYLQLPEQIINSTQLYTK